MIAFWLIGATDGHAKNFSLYLSPGGRFRMTPLYDAISAQSSADAGQIRRNRMKLAMSVGDKRHYVVDSITARHFLQTAASAGIGASVVQGVVGGLHAISAEATETVVSSLLKGFPEEVTTSLIDGFRGRLQRLDGAALSLRA